MVFTDESTLLRNKQIKDGIVQLGPTIEIGKLTFGNDEKTVNIIKQMHEECASIQDPDRCEVAHARFTCAKNTAKKYGLVPLSR